MFKRCRDACWVRAVLWSYAQTHPSLVRILDVHFIKELVVSHTSDVQSIVVLTLTLTCVSIYILALSNCSCTRDLQTATRGLQELEHAGSTLPIPHKRSSAGTIDCALSCASKPNVAPFLTHCLRWARIRRISFVYCTTTQSMRIPRSARPRIPPTRSHRIRCSIPK